jgi:hypothetical protein
VGEFDVNRSGSYHLTIVPQVGEAPILTGVNVPYSAEFRDRDTNLGLLQQLATLRPEGGAAGVLSDVPLEEPRLDQLLATDTFRPDLPRAVSIRDVWPQLLLVCGLAFLADIFVRRVALTADWILPALHWLRQRLFGRAPVTEVQQRLQQLRSRKQEVADSIDQRRAAARLAPDRQPESTSSPAPPVGQESGEKPPAAGPQEPAARPDASASEAYTARLLEAKRKAREEQQRKRRNEP